MKSRQTHVLDALAKFDYSEFEQCVLTDREHMARVGREFYLTRLGLRSVRHAFVKDGADVGRGSIARHLVSDTFRQRRSSYRSDVRVPMPAGERTPTAPRGR
jgi:hypothetical protein